MNNLILRTTNSPYGDINKGSVLAQSELDGNFVSLKGEVIYTCTTSNDLVTFTKYNGESFTFSIGTDCVFVTYSEFYDLITTSSLIPHQFYNITDFQTVYDVPDFYSNFNSKNNYAGVQASYGAIEPIIVYTTGVDTVDSQAYQPAWPNDMIKYDWTFTHTEVTSTPAFGRISERIDSSGNRTDYDHRNVFFIRYETYQKGNQLTGVITDMDGTTGFLKGFGTSFTSGEITTSEPIIIDTKNFVGYNISVNITTIVDDETLLFDIDLDNPFNFVGQSFTGYSAVHTGVFNSYKEFYIGQKNDGNYVSVPTFGYSSNVDIYIGDFAMYKGMYGFEYILSNNVFDDNSFSNKFGDRSYNNNFSLSFTNNTFGNDISSNIFGGSCDSNVFGNYFYYNVIGYYFGHNVIGNYFQTNLIAESFDSNIIGNGFNNNIIDNKFLRNEIKNDFRSNTIGHDFVSNNIGSDFVGNDIAPGFLDNEIKGSFVNNNLFGGDFVGNIVESGFNDNTIDSGFRNNKIGVSFYINTISAGFEGNSIGGYFHDNTIGDTFVSNTVSDNNYLNTFGIKTDSNIFGRLIYSNTFGESLYNNIFGTNTHDNQIGVTCIHNKFSADFDGNKIGDNFRYNQIYSAVNNVDFLPASHVYQEYTCEIIKRQDNDNRLRFTDNSDNLVYTNITA